MNSTTLRNLAHSQHGWLLALLLGASACNSKTNKGSEPTTGAQPSAAANAGPQGAVAASAARNSSPPPSLKLDETGPIPGTPISLKLPADVRRSGRPLLFRSGGEEPMIVRLTYALNITGNAETMLGNALRVYSMNDWFKPEGKPEPIAGRDLYFQKGKMTRDATGIHDQNCSGLMATLMQGSQMLSVIISFPEKRAAEAQAIVESLSIDPALKSDPQLAYGVRFQEPAGFHLSPQMFEPLYWFPSGKDRAPSEGPSLELRFRSVEERTLTNDELIPAFAKDPKTVTCVETSNSRPDHLHGQDCSLIADSVGAPFRVRIYGVEDALGSVIAIVRTPFQGAETQAEALDEFIQSMRLSEAPAQPAAQPAVQPASVLQR